MPEPSRSLHEIAAQIRSKNAGPFWITLDVFFDSLPDLRAVLASGAVTERTIAELYHVDSQHVKIFELPDLRALKMSFPRKTIAGSFEDSDMHAGQQHVPLSQMTIPLGGVGAGDSGDLTRQVDVFDDLGGAESGTEGLL